MLATDLKRVSLFFPVHQQAVEQLLKFQIDRLATLQDGIDNVRGKERTAENMADVALMDPDFFGKGADGFSLACDQPLMPTVRARWL